MKIKIALISILLTLVFLHFYAPKFIIEVNNPVLLYIQSLKSKNRAEHSSSKNGNISFNSTDLFNLKGMLKLTNKPIKGTIILIHGIRGDHTYFDPIIPVLNREGYHTLAIDLRGHGLSEGRYCTFGAKEKNDIKLAIDHLKQNYNISDNIGIWGQSLGGSVALQAMSIDSRIKFGIIESTFSSYNRVTIDYFSRLLKIELPFFVNYLANRAANIGDFSSEETNTTMACRTIDQPVFMAHGESDIHIPINHGLLNFEALKSKQKTFRIVKQADHVNLWKVGGDTYFDDIFKFIDSIK